MKHSDFKLTEIFFCFPSLLGSSHKLIFSFEIEAARLKSRGTIKIHSEKEANKIMTILAGGVLMINHNDPNCSHDLYPNYVFFDKCKPLS